MSFKNKFRDEEQYSSYIIIALFLVFSLWKFYPSLGVGVTVSQASGDGLGTITWMTDVAVQAHKQPIAYLLSDMTKIDGAGLGAFPAVPINSIQKVIIYIISFFFELDDIYDIYALLGFFLVGVSSYFLFREFGVNSFLSFFGAFLLLNNDNFYARVGGHLTLAIPFAPILVTLVVVKLSKITSLLNMFGVTSLIAFNFSMNEYYGYYGGLFSVALFLGLYFYYHPVNSLSVSNTALLTKNITITCLFFVLLMSLLYPNLVGEKIIGLFIHDNAISSAENSFRSYQDFIAYSIKNHWYLFYPASSLLPQIIDLSFFTRDTFYEQSFRVGLVIPLFILGIFVVSLISKHDWVRDRRVLLIYSFLPAIILIFLLSNDPRGGWSFVNFTYELTGIFRVSSRAYLYVAILLIVLFIIYLDVLYTYLQDLFSRKKHIYFISGVILLGVTLDDTLQYKLWTEQISVYQLPDTSFYRDLAERDQGRVIELPFYHFPEDPPEKGYPLGFYRSTYQFELVNAILPQNNPSYNGYTALYNLLKEPSEDAISFLQGIGVKYIVINSTAIKWKKGTGELKLLSQNKDRSLFQIENAVDIDKEEALNKINELAIFTMLDNDEVLFNTQESRKLLKKGFSGTEDWGVWSDSKVAKIHFKHHSDKKSYLTIKYMVFGNQNIIFHVNGDIIKSVYNTHAGPHEVQLPIKKGDSNVVEIKFEIPTALSPNSLDMNNQDTRSLGIGLLKMQ